MAKRIDYTAFCTQRKDGRFQAPYRDADGKRKFAYGKTAKEAYMKALEKMETISREPTFGDAAGLWERLKFEKLKPGTQASYEKPLKRTVEELGEIPLSQVEPYMIQRHLDRLADEGKSQSTIKAQKVLYKQILRFAMNDKALGKWLIRNPADSVEIPGNAKKKVSREAPEENIVKSIQTKAGTAHWGTFALFLLCTGMRRGEALAIQWKDVDFKSGTISVTKQVSYRGSRPTVEPPKTKSGTRTIPILKPLLPYLVKPQGAKQTDYVFHGEDPSSPVPDATYKRRWEHYCKDMGFWVETVIGTHTGKNNHTYKDTKGKCTLTAHQLRHGYATMLFEAGVDVYTAQNLLGHADLTVTQQIYTHLRNKQKNLSIDKLLAHTENGL